MATDDTSLLLLGTLEKRDIRFVGEVLIAGWIGFERTAYSADGYSELDARLDQFSVGIIGQLAIPALGTVAAAAKLMTGEEGFAWLIAVDGMITFPRWLQRHKAHRVFLPQPDIPRPCAA